MTFRGRPGNSTRRRRLCALVLVGLILASVLPAQETSDTDDSVFAPFVSRLRISIRDPEVRLTWQDSEDVDGPYLVYRHTVPITAQTFLSAQQIARVDAGVHSFIDTPPEPGDYYYAVLAATDSGEPYEVFIAYRNTTAVPVTVENIATLEERAATVRGTRASEDDGVILVEYDSDQVGRELTVYRSTRPFTSVDDLASAGVVATVLSSVESVTDYPVPGVPYYYAVVDSALVAEGAATFATGANTTADPVEIPLPMATAARPATTPGAEATPQPTAESPGAGGTPEPGTSTGAMESPDSAGGSEVAATSTAAIGPSAAAQEEAFIPQVTRRRPLPLPYLQLNTDLQTGGRIGDAVIAVPERKPISESTQVAVDAMIAGLTPAVAQKPEPEILEEDQLPAPRGAEYTLRTILEGPFANLAWEEALGQLTNFLSLPLSADIRARALFYRAQCYYFTGDADRAFVEFLLARDEYFREVEGWLDVILEDKAL